TTSNSRRATRTSLNRLGRTTFWQDAAAGLAGDLAVVVDDLAAPDRDDGPAGHFPTFVDRVVGVGFQHVVLDRARLIGVEDDDVSVAAGRKRALPRVEPEELRGVGGEHLDHALEA